MRGRERARVDHRFQDPAFCRHGRHAVSTGVHHLPNRRFRGRPRPAAVRPAQTKRSAGGSSHHRSRLRRCGLRGRLLLQHVRRDGARRRVLEDQRRRQRQRGGGLDLVHKLGRGERVHRLHQRCSTDLVAGDVLDELLHQLLEVRLSSGRLRPASSAPSACPHAAAATVCLTCRRAHKTPQARLEAAPEFPSCGQAGWRTTGSSHERSCRARRTTTASPAPELDADSIVAWPIQLQHHWQLKAERALARGTPACASASRYALDDA